MRKLRHIGHSTGQLVGPIRADGHAKPFAVRLDPHETRPPIDRSADTLLLVVEGSLTVVWRDTTSPVWQQRSAVLHETTAVLPVIADDRFFGVRAVDALGHESRTSLPKQP
jgi:hypothetical protein